MPQTFFRRALFSLFCTALLASPAVAAPQKKPKERPLAHRWEKELAPYQAGWESLDLCEPQLRPWFEATFQFETISDCRVVEVRLDSFGGPGKLIFLTTGKAPLLTERVVINRRTDFRLIDEIKEPFRRLDASFEKSIRVALRRKARGPDEAPARAALVSILLDAKRVAIFDKESAICVRYDLVPPLGGNLLFCTGDKRVRGRSRLIPEIGDYARGARRVEEYLRTTPLPVDLNTALVAPKWSRESGWYYGFLLREQSGENAGRRLGIRAYRQGGVEHFSLPAPAPGEEEITLFELF